MKIGNRLAILIVTETMGLGGVPTHILALAQSLLNKGRRVAIASAGGPFVRKLEAHGIAHYCVPLNRKRALPFAILQLYQIIRDNRFQLIHSHPRLKPILAGYLAATLNGVPTVTTVHGIFPTFLNYFYLRWMARRVIAVSQEVREHLVCTGRLSHNSISVIHNGIDLAKFVPPVTDLAKSSAAGTKIIYISRLAPEKLSAVNCFIDAALHVYSELPDLQMTIVGSGREMESVAARVAKTNAQLGHDCIKIVGGVTNPVSMIQEADAVVGVGRVILEAMACGKPAIVVGYSIGHKGGNFGGIVKPDNISEILVCNFSGRHSSVRTSPDGIGESIRELMRFPERQEALGKFGRHFVEERFGVEATADLTEQVYRKVRGIAGNNIS